MPPWSAILKSQQGCRDGSNIRHLQSKYVPSVTLNGGETEVLQKVIFDGDQLTDERARNCQWANTLARTQLERLEGTTPAFAD